jgi:thioredoxin reductase (NADPH)
VRAADGEELRGDAIVLATGAVRRRLGLPGENALRGRGVSYSVSKDRHTVVGRPAVVVGGGDSAYEGAAILAQQCPTVHLVCRGTVRARPDFLQVAQGHSNVTIHAGRTLRRLIGDEQLIAVELDDGTLIECSGLFVRVGVEPVTGFVRGELPHDDDGYLLVDHHQCCIEGVYAVGDICSPHAMSVSVAAGHAMVACKHVQQQWLHRRRHHRR